ncbi:MAG: FAD-binding oxidoreductase, partial [Methanosarcinales archaeon]
AMLLFELHGSKNAVQEDAQKLSKICIENGCIEIKVAKNEKEREELWLARRGAYPALVRIKPSPITGDVGVPISKYPDLIKKTQIVAKKYGIRLANFGHSGDGNLHFIIIADQRKSKEWERAQKVNREIIKYALEIGGTCTCEHGVGLEKKEFMRLEHGNTLDIMLALKKTLDPNNIMNQSKIFEVC